MIKIKMYPADNGDAFLVLGNTEKRKAILIDGGYARTFDKYILNDLLSLRSDGGILDLVVATHIDVDHISGLLEFFKRNGSSDSPKIIPVKDVWHNSLRSFNQEYSAAPDSRENKLISSIRRMGYPKPSSEKLSPKEIGAKHGSSLAMLLLQGNYQWNMGNGRTSINCNSTPQIALSEDVKVHVIGPPKERLDKLKAWWASQLSALGLINQACKDGFIDDAFEFLCSRDSLSDEKKITPKQISGTIVKDLSDTHTPDPSITNGSSISFILSMEDTEILFLGDAWAIDSIKGLTSIFGENKKTIFHAIKISHHGSLKNTSHELLEIIDSPRYFISTDGSRHQHPDIEVIKAIVDRPADFCRHLYFSHATPASKDMHKYLSKSGADFTIHEHANDWIDIKP